MKLLLGSLALALVAIALTNSLAAQEAGLSTAATETITIKPQRIRLSMWVKSQGSDMKSALKVLNDHKVRVRKDLLAMKADEASISFSATRLAEGSTAQDPNMARYQQMMIMQMRANGGDAEVPKMPVIFTATAALKAEWTLPVQEGDALAILPASLKQQITARDLAGENNKPELDEEQQERMEELQAQMDDQYGGYYGSDESSQGPLIQFVADVSDEQIQVATKAAYAAAVKKAESLVAAVGLKLGGLRTVSNHSSDSAYLDQTRYYAAQYGGSELPNSHEGMSENTITAENVDELVMAVTVSVSYAIAN
jgi:uncharacterized protein YggE